MCLILKYLTHSTAATFLAICIWQEVEHLIRNALPILELVFVIVTYEYLWMFLQVVWVSEACCINASCPHRLQHQQALENLFPLAEQNWKSPRTGKMDEKLHVLFSTKDSFVAALF